MESMVGFGPFFKFIFLLIVVLDWSLNYLRTQSDESFQKPNYIQMFAKKCWYVRGGPVIDTWFENKKYFSLINYYERLPNFKNCRVYFYSYDYLK
jgi:hypothetical protein